MHCRWHTVRFTHFVSFFYLLPPLSPFHLPFSIPFSLPPPPPLSLQPLRCSRRGWGKGGGGGRWSVVRRGCRWSWGREGGPADVPHLPSGARRLSPGAGVQPCEQRIPQPPAVVAAQLCSACVHGREETRTKCRELGIIPEFCIIIIFSRGHYFADLLKKKYTFHGCFSPCVNNLVDTTALVVFLRGSWW